MAGIKNKACVPSTSWNRLRKLYGNEKIDYYNLLEESYLSARKNGTLTERKDEEVAYLLNRPSVTGKTVAVRYVPNADSYRAKNPQWIWYLSEIKEMEPAATGEVKKERRKLVRSKNGKLAKTLTPTTQRVIQVPPDKPAKVNRPTETPSVRQNNAVQAAEGNGAAKKIAKNNSVKTAHRIVDALPPEIAGHTAGGEEVGPNVALRQFAWLGAEVEFYNDLYKMMKSEPWYFSNDPHNASLASYINYTFYRLQTEQKIVYSLDNQYAAFNTGLVDNRDNEIYALFAREPGYRQEWVYRAFCIRGTGDGKILSEKFVEFPEKADYALDPRLQQIGRDTELDVDFQHIVIANAGRLPEETLIDESDRETKSPLKNILVQRRRMKEQGDREGVTQQNYKLGTLVAEHEEWQNRLLDRLEEHIKVARDRVDQNPAIAIPVYYPGKNTMSVILPLYRFRDDDIAYGALVVGITPAGNYQAHTLLTPKMAYVDARIVRPIDSLWLMKAYLADNEEN
ncbi:MAG: DUF3825 domain-containing protein [Negativicoccus succinicivorans]|uniref:DUF3825 domain-containing protein n=1 Tax=Negativicoccus succinicivorans DORA_17_25 TaxID=1403945 RepID=W1U8Z7_9FIRM|nr:DUF3825 domain-containing protein [Negativicoccus succinicivorans]ETI88123.1 MAG: hypothetical protein Q612_NSC00208G0001 [Negativicoccus succinicivorans DORA_17_25]MBS5917805.1 DUF3825 domain-containing protein [Negativicoccus succinicivorans]MDU1056545.1 DUF3825 domain-containing protein [Negativicoccus succinicivorans]